MRRRIVYMLGTLGPGGAERQVLTLLRALDRTRWEPIVYAMRSGLLADEFAKVAAVRIMNKTRKVEPLLPLRIRRLFDVDRPDIVHTYMSTANTWGRLAIALRASGRPVVIAAERDIDTWKTSVHLAIDQLLLGVTDAVVGNSQAVSRHIIRHHHLPPQKVYTIPNGIDLARAQRHLHCSPEERRVRRAALGFGPEHFVIGHIGRPAPAKGLDVLLEVIERLYRGDRSVRLLRVSQPPLPREQATAEAFEQAVAERGLEEIVHFHPFTPDISAALVVMDALVQTSFHEGLPNVVMEAMAMERPVVATAAGGTPELIRHRQTGWLVPIGDVDGLVAGIEYVRQHPDEARAWGQAARRLIETEYSVERMVERTVALYEQLLAKRA